MDAVKIRSILTWGLFNKTYFTVVIDFLTVVKWLKCLSVTNTKDIYDKDILRA
jgi:hypothetical protein